MRRVSEIKLHFIFIKEIIFISPEEWNKVFSFKIPLSTPLLDDASGHFERTVSGNPIHHLCGNPGLHFRLQQLQPALHCYCYRPGYRPFFLFLSHSFYSFPSYSLDVSQWIKWIYWSARPQTPYWPCPLHTWRSQGEDPPPPESPWPPEEPPQEATFSARHKR